MMATEFYRDDRFVVELIDGPRGDIYQLHEIDTYLSYRSHRLEDIALRIARLQKES